MYHTFTCQICHYTFLKLKNTFIALLQVLRERKHVFKSRRKNSKDTNNNSAKFSYKTSKPASVIIMYWEARKKQVHDRVSRMKQVHNWVLGVAKYFQLSTIFIKAKQLFQKKNLASRRKRLFIKCLWTTLKQLLPICALNVNHIIFASSGMVFVIVAHLGASFYCR